MIELVSERPDRVVCRPVGDLDIYSVDAFRRVISDVTRSGVALKIDLMHLTYVDLVGARAISNASGYVSSGGSPTLVVGGTRAIRRMVDYASERSS